MGPTKFELCCLQKGLAKIKSRNLLLPKRKAFHSSVGGYERVTLAVPGSTKPQQTWKGTPCAMCAALWTASPREFLRILGILCALRGWIASPKTSPPGLESCDSCDPRDLQGTKNVRQQIAFQTSSGQGKEQTPFSCQWTLKGHSPKK